MYSPQVDGTLSAFGAPLVGSLPAYLMIGGGVASSSRLARDSAPILAGLFIYLDHTTRHVGS